MIRSKRLRWILLISGLVAIAILWILSNQKFSAGTVGNVVVNIHSKGEEPLIAASNVLNHLKKEEVVLTGMRVSELDLSYIERTLNKFPFVAASSVYVDYFGNLHLDVEERTPLLRIIPDDRPSHYLDSRGFPFPLSELHTARVPVATGHIDTSLNSKLYILGRYVQESGYWKHLIDHIFVRSSGDIAFTTKLGNQDVVLGDVDRLEGKMEKLRRFYRTASGKIGWDTYREINLKYKDQVVCK
ncbi:MAG: hypothetical protein H6606_00620 [Flavobacteriales bacterium]|nr:hypothetical protein [Flavobacteriales bacterium]